MTPAARVAAAIDILADIETRHRPAADALKDWGLGHRFAGSKDRAALASARKPSRSCASWAFTRNPIKHEIGSPNRGANTRAAKGCRKPSGYRRRARKTAAAIRDS